MLFLDIVQFFFGLPFKVILFLCFFTVPLKRRNLFYLKVIFFGILYIASFYFINITYGVLYNIVLFSLSTLWMFACFNSSFYALLYTAIGAFAGYSISQYIYKLIQIIIGFPDNIFTSIFLSLSLCFFVATLCYFLLIRNAKDTYMTKSGKTIINSIIILGLTIICDQFLPKGKEITNILFYAYAIVSCVLALIIQYSTFKNNEVEFDKKELERLMKIQSANQKAAQQNIEMVNMRCHDLKKQIELLSYEKDSSTVREELIKQLQDTVNDYDSIISTGWEPLDAVLFEKNNICKKNDITFSYIADGKALSFLSELDAYTLFANALDNAIESEKKQAKVNRVISLSAIKLCGFVRIKIENYHEGEVKFIGELPVTTKMDGELHGYGTKSMLYLVKKYHGTMNMSLKDYLYTVNIVIPLPEEKTEEVNQEKGGRA